MSEAQPGVATAPSPRTKIKRGPTRARYGSEEVLAILADGLVCHVATIIDGHPAMIPIAYAVVDGELCLHGSTANRILRALRDGAEACVTVTHLDGLVMARSAFRHSVNYRSVVIYGHAREVTEADEKGRALGLLIDHVVPGRRAAVRAPDREELLRTMVLMLPLDEASAKVRTGPPIDLDADFALDVWAGVIPLRMAASVAIPDDRTSLPVSPEVARKVRQMA